MPRTICTTNETLAELRRLTKEGGGVLNPAAVVESARAEDSPLHDRFTWDDTEAAHQYRLEEARRLIRVHVEIVGQDTAPSPVWVSLASDQAAGGGYRPLVKVLSHAEQRAELLAQAKDDMRRFAAKYRRLTELADVVAAMRKAM
jgi:hypothetical protein